MKDHIDSTKHLLSTDQVCKEAGIEPNFFRTLRPELVNSYTYKARKKRGFEYYYHPRVVEQIKEVLLKMNEGLGVTEQKRQKLIEKTKSELKIDSDAHKQKLGELYMRVQRVTHELLKLLSEEDIKEIKSETPEPKYVEPTLKDPEDYALYEYLKLLDPTLGPQIYDLETSFEEIQKDEGEES